MQPEKQWSPTLDSRGNNTECWNWKIYKYYAVAAKIVAGGLKRAKIDIDKRCAVCEEDIRSFDKIRSLNHWQTLARDENERSFLNALEPQNFDRLKAWTVFEDLLANRTEIAHYNRHQFVAASERVAPAIAQIR